mmetsp:Transcript_7743/g.14359  ORF Transcript_7743/g.14359 Transcript_7743/m.14359 type:complete len:1158 (-) Transcript_7743:72-3545(-)
MEEISYGAQTFSASPLLEGILELRPPGVMGKWEERWFSLDDTCLRHCRMIGADSRDESTLDSFPLDQIENLLQDGNEFSFTVGLAGRKSRIRGKADSLPTLDEWHQSVQDAVARAKDPSLLHVDTQDLSARNHCSPKSAKSPKNKTDEPATSPQNKSQLRVEELYKSHQTKLDKLKEMRIQEEENERKKHERDFEAIKSHTRPRRTQIGAKDVAKTAQRLFNEHRYMQQRMEEKRIRHEEQERERIEHNKYRSRPTRSQSDPSLTSAHEAGLRLYGDAERREQWRQEAKDAQVKEELSMVTIGSNTRTGSTNAVMRCVELYRESIARKDRLEKERLRKQKEEKQRMDEDSVPCGKGRKGPDHKHINNLFEEHQERQKTLNTLRKRKLDQELKDLIAVPKARIPVGVSIVNRKMPPWKDKEFPWNLMKKKDSVSVATDNGSGTSAKGGQTSQADYALLAIATSIGLRSGFHQYVIRPADQQILVTLLKGAMGVYKTALEQISGDPGYANLCTRPSQRLFQEHLLPEVEGWSHRLEPDAIRQVEDDLDTLLNCAARAQEQLKDKIAPGVPWSTGHMKQHPAGVPTALWAYDPGLKERSIAETKAMVKFGPGEGPQRFRHLVDLSRLGIVFASCDMLQVGLDHILKRFEVVDVRNYFATPGRLGRRYVEVLVVEKIPDGRDELPHVCELRLEPQIFYNANQTANEKYLKEFYKHLKKVYAHAHMDLDAVETIAHQILDKTPEGHRLRSFRCHLGRRFGSPVCGWRKALGGGRLLNFQRLREVCYALKIGEHVTELWEELDPGRGGCISLWELDPEACALLTKLRSRLIAVLGPGTGSGRTMEAPPELGELDAKTMFDKLLAWVKPVRDGQLELHEFRAIARPLGFNQAESDRLFAALDQFGGSQHAPPATINASDIAWLKKLPTLIDTDAVACAQEHGYTMTDEWKNMTLAPRHSSISTARASMRPALENGSIGALSSPSSVASLMNGGLGRAMKAWEEPTESPKRNSQVSGRPSRAESAPPKPLGNVVPDANKAAASPQNSSAQGLAATAPATAGASPPQAPSSIAREDTAKPQEQQRSSLKTEKKSSLKEAPASVPHATSPSTGDQSTNLGDQGVYVEEDEEDDYYEGEEEEEEYDEDMEEEEDEDPEELLPDNEETW